MNVKEQLDLIWDKYSVQDPLHFCRWILGLDLVMRLPFRCRKGRAVIR